MLSMSKFKGSTALLLQEYFDLKVKLSELQLKMRYRKTSDLEDRIRKVEVSIIEILSMFDQRQLLQIIHMSLDIDYDKLKEDKFIRSSTL
jgi:hypothetical protein